MMAVSKIVKKGVHYFSHHPIYLIILNCCSHSTQQAHVRKLSGLYLQLLSILLNLQFFFLKLNL